MESKMPECAYKIWHFYHIKGRCKLSIMTIRELEMSLKEAESRHFLTWVKDFNTMLEYRRKCPNGEFTIWF